MFHAWAAALPPEIEVCPVQLPGRESRLGEAPFTRVLPLVQTLERILPVHHLPYAFYGHSMGALISFELARALRRDQGLSPVHLFVAAYRAPHLPTPLPTLEADASDAMLVEALRHAGNTPTWMLEDRRVLPTLLPTLRADMQLVKMYRYTPDVALACPISVFGGTEDSLVSRDQLAAWRVQTCHTFQLHMMPGDHFFVHSAQARLLRTLAHELTRP